MSFRSCNDKAKVIEEQALVLFCTHYLYVVDAYLNSQQHMGCGYDFLAQLNNGEYLRVEVKDDASSVRTGNLFIEFQQNTFDFAKQEYTDDYVPSGIFLKQCDVLMVKSGTIWYILRPRHLIDWLLSDKCTHDVVTTREKANGNRPGKAARGFLVPVSQLPDFVVYDIITDECHTLLRGV